MSDLIDKRNWLITELARLGIERVVIDYSGSGDDGSINEISAYKVGEDPDNLKVRHDVDEIFNSFHEPGQIATRVSNELLDRGEKNLSTILSDFAYIALDHMSVPDWINNDGGGGKMTIYVQAVDGHEAGKVVTDHYYNEMKETYGEYEL